MNIIEVKNLSKAFKQHVALSDVTISVKEGEIYGLIGPNGAGKSTLLKLITGVLQADSGQIFYRGQSIQSSHMQEIGAIIEHPAIYPNLTARENLEVMTTLLHLDKKRIGETLQTVDLQRTGKKIVKHFSLGMKQRLGIAMALIIHPKVLILDEPTNGLDPIGIQELRELLRLLASQGVTIILSSHILSEVQQVADTIGMINQGHVSYQGPNNQKAEDLEQLFLEIVKKERTDVN
ncbi:lantibiotic protection ABC transporter ATP-binding subunit [Enterococcus saccharolyticus]|uniref:Lantibiotic ABC transporter ATP-binding protein n=1 Tax=Candidatus Enterococcus willemsii TaxID=1857215 RepID=A0ABQ6YVU2_9ENTE|nr:MULTISPECIES: lantibiotic protection ABC transporter ATP-binding subunit [Enterococcus]KAF1301452.1 lantibiotic ABC transporter ATP-binding protein [Enterococcus sp. CU12B]MCD5003100.1 lantibiotic protection ABC transporter ATP-binding subunit [Enterococcus saccharolyticus]